MSITKAQIAAGEAAIEADYPVSKYPAIHGQLKTELHAGRGDYLAEVAKVTKPSSKGDVPEGLTIEQYANLPPTERSRIADLIDSGKHPPLIAGDADEELTQGERFARGEATDEDVAEVLAADAAKRSDRAAEKRYGQLSEQFHTAAEEAARIHGTDLQTEVGYLFGDAARRLREAGKDSEADGITAAFKWGQAQTKRGSAASEAADALRALDPAEAGLRGSNG